MAFSSWIGARLRGAPRHLTPKARKLALGLRSRRYRPALELLEDRLAPATLTVNTLADSTGGSHLSLRDAILAVDGGGYSGPATGQVSGTFGSNDTILFQSGLNGTLSLVTASGPLVISSNLTITATPTQSAITISGQFAASQTGVFEVTSTATATIAGLTITQGKDSINLFGGIYVEAGGTLTVNGCTFVNNQSAGAGGGAILNAGTLTVTNSTFNANSGVAGGAIDNTSGATATLINCTISGNQATSGSGSGGGVANAGSLTLLNTLIAQNTSAGSDPDVAGAFTSSGHNLIGNATGSTGLTDGINGDQVGSAAPFTGDLTSGLATIDNVSSTAGLVVGQLITDTAGAIPAGTVIAVLGLHSITLSQAATKSQMGDGFISSVYADLGPLQNNGGGIETMALLPTSCAIDAGANSDPVLTVPTVDERGVGRPQAGTVDIGAVEANELVVTSLNDSGAGSLRDALTQSNSITGTVLIDFQAGLTGTISLTTGHLEIVHDDWIRGPGASQITVDGNLNYWCFGVDSQYTVSGALHVAIAGLTMTRGEQTQGFSDGRGGAVSYRNTSPATDELTIEDCVIENSGGSGVNNGGIYAEDGLSVSNTQIIDNTSGIYISGPRGLDVSNSWIANNTGDGIFSDVNTVLTNSTFSGNGSSNSGDGVYMGDKDATVTNCTFTGNQGRGFVINYQDTALLTNSTLVGDVGSDLLSIGGNAIARNSIVDKLDTQNGFGTITSEGNNLFRSAAPSGMTVLASDLGSPGVSSSSNAFGGSLKSGTYYYVIAAVTATGTLTSADWPISVGFNNMKVSLSWTAPVGISGLTGYQIFRGTSPGAEKLIATVSAGTTSLTDTGIAGTSGVPLLLGALANNGGPMGVCLAPAIPPTAAGSVYTSNKASSAFAPFLDECGYLRNPIYPGIGAFESVSSTPNTVSLSPPSLVGIDQGLDYSQAITASGGTDTGYLIGVTAGALPPGFTLTLGGALMGTATTVGAFAFTVTGFDDAGNFGSTSYTLNVNTAPALTTSSLALGTENAAYSQALQTSGGTAPFTWSYTGALPNGITFDASTATFGGTPALGSAGTYDNIQVTATDSDGESATQTYAMTIHWVIGLSPALPADTVSISYNQTQNITGGSGTYSALNVTGLPTGLTASLSGTMLTISGTPTVTGTFPLSIALHDDGNNSDSNVAGENLIVNPPPAITTTSLPDWTESVAYNQSIATTGGTAPLTFSLSAGTLPAGLSLDSSSGAITGVPDSVGNSTFTIEAQDNVGSFDTHQYSVTINAPVALTTTTVADWTQNIANYSQTVQTAGGTSPLAFSIAAGTLPHGLSLNTSSGAITGTPDTVGNSTFTIKAQDSVGSFDAHQYTIHINAPVAITTTTLTDWTQNVANYSQTVQTTGGTGPLAFSVSAGTLPAGLSLDSNSGAITGRPDTVGSSTFTIKAQDNVGSFDTHQYAVTINAPPAITTATLPEDTTTVAYNATVNTTGGTSPLAFSVSAGTLPHGLSLDTSSGAITGTPDTAGSYPITVSVTDAAGAVFSQPYTVVINAVSLGALSFNQWTLNKTGFIGTIAASTGTGAFTFSMTSGKLPTGMTDALSGGLITFAGKPTVAGTYSFTLKLTDSLGVTASQSYTIVINPATTFIWTGQGGDANWTTPGNWSGAGAAPLAGDTLIFPAGVTQKTANNNFPSATRFAALVFQDGGYTITGNNLKLSAGISSTSSAGGTDTVALNVALTATKTFNIAGTTLIDVTGTISGKLLGITKTGTGTLAYDSPSGNTYTGLTTVSGGTLQLNANNQIVDTASVAVNAGAVFDLNGHDETIANLTLTGGTVNTGIGTLTLSGSVTSNAASASADINGTLNLTNAKPTLTVNKGIAGDGLVIAATISAGSLTKSGTGTLVLSGNNASYTGTTKVSGGVLDVQNPAALGSGPVVALMGTTVQVDGDGLTIGNSLTLGSTGGATLGNLAGGNTWSGPITDAVSSTITVSAGTLTVNGGISGVGGLTKSGAGTLLLPAANSYKGTTKVSAGVLDVQTPAALGNNTSLTVIAAGTLEIDGTDLTFSKTLSLSGTLANPSGSNTWSGKISTLAATSTINVGTGQSLTLSGIISGTGSLTKVGAGTLIVSALNTYTGTTTVNGGTLGGGGKVGSLLAHSGATVAPSATTTQILKTGKVAFSAGSTFTVTLDGTTAGTGYDQLSVSGTVNLAGATLKVNLGFTPALGSAFTLIQNDGTDPVVGTFAGLPQGATLSLGGMTFQISYVGGTGNDVVLTRVA